MLLKKIRKKALRSRRDAQNLKRNLGLVLVLLAEVLGGANHVAEGTNDLGPLAGLETAVRVDPELLGAEELKHLLDALLDLLLAGNTRAVDIVDTRSDVAGVLRVDEDLEELSIGLGVLDGEDIGIQGSDGVEEVLELRVAEVRVDLSGVLNAGGGELEAVDSPLEVGITLSSLAERETLTKGRLIDLDDEDAVLLEVDDLVTESKSKLLALHGLVDVITGERPPEAGDGTSKHALHGLLGDGRSILGLLDGHGSGAGDIADNDRGTDAAGAVRLNPGVGGEDVAGQTLTEVLNHVVTLGLTVNVDIKVELILVLDSEVNLLLDEVVVLLSADLALGELVALDTDLIGLGERSDGGGGEEGQLEVGLLLGIAGLESTLAVVHLRGNLGLALLDLGVVGAGRLGTSLDGGSVGIKLSADGVGVGHGLGEDGNLLGLLSGEREPVVDLSGELLLAGESVGSVEKGAGGGNDDALLTKGLDGGLDKLNGLGEVVLPDVTAVDNTSREDLLGAELLENRLELLGVADKVNVETLDVGESREDVEVVDDIAEVGGDNDRGDGRSLGGDGLIGRLESSLDLGLEIVDEDGLVNLDGLGTGSLERLQELNVDGDKLVKERDGVDRRATVSLAKSKERDGANNDGAGLESSLLSLEELPNGLGVLGKGEGLVILESGLHVVVVGVKPLDHLKGGDIDTALLVATAHGKVLIERRELLAGVTLGDGLKDSVLVLCPVLYFSIFFFPEPQDWYAYIEELDVVKDVVVVGKVVGGDDVDTSILLDLPVSETESLALSEEVLLGDLVGPVGLVGLLEVTEDTNSPVGSEEFVVSDWPIKWQASKRSKHQELSCFKQGGA